MFWGSFGPRRAVCRCVERAGAARKTSTGALSSCVCWVTNQWSEQISERSRYRVTSVYGVGLGLLSGKSELGGELPFVFWILVYAKSTKSPKPIHMLPNILPSG
jgi:hypothetical protein